MIRFVVGILVFLKQSGAIAITWLAVVSSNLCTIGLSMILDCLPLKTSPLSPGVIDVI